MKPKLSWDSATAGSLTLTVKTDTHTVSWDLRKNTPADKLRKIFGEVMLELSDADFDALQSAYERSDYADWSDTYDDPPEWALMKETAHTVDQAELDAIREAASKQALADKADSFKLENGMFWGSNDLDELELYELGTGDPE